MATAQGIQWETGATPANKQSAFKSLYSKKYTFTNPFRGDPTKPKKSIWEKNPFNSVVTTNDKPTIDEGAVKSPRRPSKRNRIIIGVSIIVILALIIGLAVGLTRNRYVNLNAITSRSF